MALELNKRAWGLFWAGGGVQRCREVMAERVSETEACSGLVPATPEALLRLILDLEPAAQDAPRRRPWRRAATPEPDFSQTGPNPCKLVAWTSLAWMAVLGLTVAGFLDALERQDRKLDSYLSAAPLLN